MDSHCFVVVLECKIREKVIVERESGGCHVCLSYFDRYRRHSLKVMLKLGEVYLTLLGGEAQCKARWYSFGYWIAMVIDADRHKTTMLQG